MPEPRPGPWRLSDAQKARIKRDHPIVNVLARMGIDPPEHWDGASPYRIRAAALGFPHGRDDSQGVLVSPEQNRWWAFHAGFGGDVLELVRRTTSADSLLEAARLLDSRAPIACTELTDDLHATVIGFAERPDLTRTCVRRVLEANAVAWRFLTLPRLADQARAYLTGRGIDVTHLEAEVGRPLAGHTPLGRAGLVAHLRGKRFTDDEIVDSGWGVRRPGEQLRDRYHNRVLLPFRDARERVLGVTGRDVAGRNTAKYLNHPRTLAFDKSAVLYRPHRRDLHPQATVIVCEGTLDALAIAAAAARVGASDRYAPLTQSGLSLTDLVAPAVFGLHPRPVVFCGDADLAGQHAMARWAERAIRVYHREVLTVALPDGLDPADWLAREGPAGLAAFTRPGCLEDAHHIRPRPAGALLAHHELDRALDGKPSTALDAVTVAPRIVDRLGQLAAELRDDAATRRFATTAGEALAQLVDGLGAQARTRQVLDAAHRNSCFLECSPVTAQAEQRVRLH